MTARSSENKKSPVFVRRWRRRALAAVVVILLLVAYNLRISQLQECSAQVTVGAPPAAGSGVCPSAGSCSGTACETPGAGAAAAASLLSSFFSGLSTAATNLENFLYNAINHFLTSEYIQVEWLEQSMIDWWKTMWYYNLLPGLQSMTRELNVNIAMQALLAGANADATDATEVSRALDRHAVQDHGVTPGEQVCVAATTTGGLTRATSFSTSIRQAWEAERVANGLNTTDPADPMKYPGSSSAAGAMAHLYKDHHEIFCDPQGNSGSNNCLAGLNIDPSSPKYLANADVEPSKYIYNNLTIKVDAADNTADPDKGPKLAKAVESIIDNMVGVPAADTMPAVALGSPPGHEKWLARRSFIARYAAIRSVPDLIVSWRMPGSKMGNWVSDLRSDAGVPADEISQNPSYKEIMHALSVDRFNGGALTGESYAAKMLTDENKIEMEKLNLSVFYLMQLRDYYELLERTALALSVQVSMLNEHEQKKLPSAYVSMPLQ